MNEAINVKLLPHFRPSFRSNVVQNALHHRLTIVRSWNL
jgi:hypothetical protein